MDEFEKVIQLFCDADRRNGIVSHINEKFITAMSPTLKEAYAWAKEKSASAATDTDYTENI